MRTVTDQAPQPRPTTTDQVPSGPETSAMGRETRVGFVLVAADGPSVPMRRDLRREQVSA